MKPHAKKKFMLTVLCLSAHSGFSGTMGPLAIAKDFDAKNGLYLGAGVAGSFDHYQLKASNVVTGLSTTNTKNSSHVIGNAFIGYGYTAPNLFYLAGEVGTNFPERTTTIPDRHGVTLTPYTFSDKLQTQDYVTLDMVPGFRVKPNWLLYGRAGIAFSKLSLNQAPNAAAGTVGFNASQNKVGGRFGAGVTYALTQHFAASVDYYYSVYQTASMNWPIYNIHFKSTPNSNFIGASIAYTI